MLLPSEPLVLEESREKGYLPTVVWTKPNKPGPTSPRGDLSESLPVAQSLLIKDFAQVAKLTDKVLVKKSAAELNHSGWETKFPPEKQNRFGSPHCIWPHSSSARAVFIIGRKKDDAFFQHSTWLDGTVVFHPDILSKSCTLCKWLTGHASFGS